LFELFFGFLRAGSRGVSALPPKGRRSAATPAVTTDSPTEPGKTFRAEI